MASRRGTDRDTLRGGFITLLAVATLALTAYFMLVTLVPLSVVRLGVEAHLLGAIASLAFLLPLLLAIPVGRGVDRFGSKPVLVLGAVVLALVVMPSAMAVSLPTLIALQAVVGLVHVFILLAGQALAASLGEERDRLRRVGLFTLSVAGGQLIGPPIAGAVFDIAGPRAGFALVVGTALAAGAAALFLPRVRQRCQRAASEHDRPHRVNPLRFFDVPAFGAALVTSSSVLLCITLMHTFLPLRLSDLPNPGTVVGTLLGVMALASIVVRPFVSPLARILGGNRAALLNVALLVFLGTFALGSTTSVAALTIAVAMIGLASGISQPLSIVMVLQDRPAAQHGVALGARISGNRLAQLIGPLAVGASATLIGVGPALIVTAGALTFVNAVARQRWGTDRRRT